MGPQTRATGDGSAGAARRGARAARGHVAAAALLLSAGGCTTPFNDDSERTLQRAVVDAVRRELREPMAYPDATITQRSGSIEDLKIPDRFMEELTRMAGPESYDAADPASAPLGLDLLGSSPRTVKVSLERAMRSAVANNLELQFASLGPAVAQVQIAQAEAAFDWVLFANVERSWLDDQNLVSGTTISRNAREVIASRAGVRRALGTGAAFTIQQDITYTRVRQNGTTARGSQSTSLNWSFQFDQPLMRDFGADVALSQVRLARNAERNQVAVLERQLLQTTTQVERTYWQLWQSYHDLMILQRLVLRGREVADKMAIQDFRTNPANIANARARVVEREANVLRAQIALRQVSDQLKLLMNDPSIPVGSEIMVLPVDRPVDEPISFNLGESLFTAIERRPEVAQSILSLDDTSTRLLAAANGRLPQLDARFQARLNGLEDETSQAYQQVAEGNFGSFVFGLFFEQTIGNRDAEAVYARRRLERSQAVISYMNTIQAITNEVKRSLDNVATFYQLIIKTRLQRVAASEVLRSLIVQSQSTEGVTPERLDLELGRQEALAQAERQEIEALVQYNISIAEWFAAQGTALDRNRIKFVVPSVAESLHWPYLPGESAGYAHQWWERQSQRLGEPPTGAPDAEPATSTGGEPVVERGGEPTGTTPGAEPPTAPVSVPTMFPIQPAPGSP